MKTKNKIATFIAIIINVTIFIIVAVISYAIATSDLPSWFKFWLLR